MAGCGSVKLSDESLGCSWHENVPDRLPSGWASKGTNQELKVDRLETAQSSYWERFKLSPPMPFGVADKKIAAVLEHAVENGLPVPESFDWWQDLPPDAAA